MSSPLEREDEIGRGGSAEEIAERQRVNNVLESMMGSYADDIVEEEEEQDPQVDWLVDPLRGGDSAMEGVWIDGDDDDEEEEDDDEYFDDEFIDDEEDDEFDEDAEVDGEDIIIEGDDDDEDGAIDLSAIIRAATQGTAAGDEDGANTRAQRALSSIGIEGLRRLLQTGRLQFRRNDANGEDEEEEDAPLYYGGPNRRGVPSRMAEFWDRIKEPIDSGAEMLYGGEFGRPPSRPVSSPKSAFAASRNLTDAIFDRRKALRRVEKHELANYVPNTDGTEVARYPSRAYCGQYSEDSSFFHVCTQSFQLFLYDTTASPSRQVHRYEERPRYSRSQYYSSGTTHLTALKPIKNIQGRQGSWTITDAALSPDNHWMIYSSITPYVYLVPTRKEVESGGASHSDNQVMLDFSNQGSDDAGVRWRSGIWSIRFSGDSREIVAGAHFGDIYVYDIEARRRVLKVEGHSDDVNGVTFADSASSHVLISGSDDSYVKVWDRRSLSSGKPAGVLPGHTEGITFVAPKGDGRYCISNGKDQSTKLWDLRRMMSSADFESSAKVDCSLRNWDYRNSFYKKPRYDRHPDDCSVMTYRGHAVLRTLIRCHFSPVATTGQKYIYSGSADGRIHIWSLDGRVVQVLDRSKVIPLCAPGSSEASDPSAAIPKSNEACGRSQAYESSAYGRGLGSSEACTVRDVSWHSSEPALMSTAWDGPDGQHGSIAKHEWKGYGKNGLSLEDAIEKTIEEAAR